MAKIIAISNHKGGVGKTTSTVNIGAGLAKLKNKVLLVDMDPQANLTQSLGVIDPKHHIYGALSQQYGLMPIELRENLSIVPATLDLSGAEIELSSETGREFILRELLESLHTQFDYVVIDCPPSLGLLTVNALTAAHEVFVPLQAQYLALQGLTKLMEIIEKIRKRLNRKLKLGGVFVTQYDSRKVLNREVAETIERHFNGQAFKTKIRDNVALAEAPSQGMDIFTYNKKCYGAKDYLSLCKEILERDHSR